MSSVPQRILIDTGPLVALFDRRDAYHAACREQARYVPGTLFTCLPVITEACYLLNRYDSNLVHHLLAACRDGVYTLLPLHNSDVAAIDAIIRKYQDLCLDFADAALMHLSEREGIEHIFTLDRRDFSVFLTLAGKPLVLLP
ncbi:MAG: PIN domain-containing protein [Pirellulales bacterium]